MIKLFKSYSLKISRIPSWTSLRKPCLWNVFTDFPQYNIKLKNNTKQLYINISHLLMWTDKCYYIITLMPFPRSLIFLPCNDACLDKQFLLCILLYSPLHNPTLANDNNPKPVVWQLLSHVTVFEYALKPSSSVGLRWFYI